MSRSLLQVGPVAVAVAALMISGAAQAGDLSFSVTSAYGAYRQVQYERVGSRFHDDDGFGERRYVREHRDYGYRDPDRYYGRPVRDRDHWDRHRWHRPIADRPHWRDGEDCTVIIKKRVNEWGDRVVTRIKRCG
jgi:hypothetical protein